MRIPGIYRLILPLVLALAGCDSGSGDAALPAPGTAATNAEREQLLARDQAFSAAVGEVGLAEAYRRFLAADAVQLPDGDWPLSGREAIYRQIDAATAGSEFQLSWLAEDADVSAAGDLGYTWGIYSLESEDEEGQPVVVEGNYLNVWRKSADGDWLVVADISNQIATDFIPNAESELPADE